jgi:hypothetical protein
VPNEARIMRDSCAALGVLLPTVQYTTVVFNTWHTLSLYRRRVLDMRRGKYCFSRSHCQQHFCNRFIGFQVAGSAMYSVVICGFFGIVIFMPAVFAVLVLVSGVKLERTRVCYRTRHPADGISRPTLQQHHHARCLRCALTRPSLCLAWLPQSEWLSSNRTVNVTRDVRPLRLKAQLEPSLQPSLEPLLEPSLEPSLEPRVAFAALAAD